MITPTYLKPGDKIGLVAPARKISVEEISKAIEFITLEGFQVEYSPDLFASNNQFGGTDIQRKTSFQEMLDNPEIKAILAVRGGYGSVRIIDDIDFTLFKKNPKWICGFSDVTVFHSHIHSNYKIETLHCTMPFSINDDLFSKNNIRYMIDALTGRELKYNTTPHSLNRYGEASGIVIGGNLSILYSLIGSLSDINTDNKILLIEDVDEYLYHIDRMMMNLKRSGKLANLAGIIVGGMTEMNDNTIPFGKSAEEIVAEHCAEYSFPVCFNFPVGHGEKNFAIRLGQITGLKVDSNGGYIFQK